ncbi:MAG: tyrosine--tRNA ligase [Planctomycetota bacterium]
MTTESVSSCDPQASLAAFERGAVDLIDRERLTKRLANGQPLRIKFGMDPSSPDLHVGHAIPLLKLRDLQRLGHQIVLIVGDATAMVGDPSGRNQLRPTLSREQVEENLKTYVEQASLVLDMERTEVRRNTEWFDALDFAGLLQLTGRMTVAQMLERDMFQKRMQNSEPIGIHEFLYPLLQGWDSVEVRADIEFGGTDQLFNLLVGRTFQEQEGQRPQEVLTTPLINGSDGRKMSKSYGNAIPMTAEPNDMFGKVMAQPDDVMEVWFTQLTRLDEAEIAELLAGHPRTAKARLAREVVAQFHGTEAAAGALDAFDRQFKQKQLPDDIPDKTFGPWPAEGVPLAILLRELGLAQSSSEARRLIQQGGVKLEGEAQKDPNFAVPAPGEPLLIQVGKRRFARVTAQG